MLSLIFLRRRSRGNRGLNDYPATRADQQGCTAERQRGAITLYLTLICACAIDIGNKALIFKRPAGHRGVKVKQTCVGGGDDQKLRTLQAQGTCRFGKFDIIANQQCALHPLELHNRRQARSRTEIRVLIVAVQVRLAVVQQPLPILVDEHGRVVHQRTG